MERMEEMKHDAGAGITRKISKLLELRDAIDSLPNDLKVETLYEAIESICMSIPYDLKRMRETRAKLGRNWKVFQKPRVMDDGDWVVEYQNVENPCVHLTLFACTYHEGATCHREQIGTREVPVYHIVCA